MKTKLLNSTSIDGGALSPSATDPNAIMTEAEAAKMTSLSVRSLQRSRYTGEGGPPHIQLSERRVGYRYGDVVAGLASRSRTSTSAATVAARAEAGA
jgi:hypothetical protein